MFFMLPPPPIVCSILYPAQEVLVDSLPVIVSCNEKYINHILPGYYAIINPSCQIVLGFITHKPAHNCCDTPSGLSSITSNMSGFMCLIFFVVQLYIKV